MKFTHAAFKPLFATKLVAICVGITWAGDAFSQQNTQPPVQNVVQLSATGSVEVQQDLLGISMNATREGPDAGAVQTHLKVALDAALSEVKNPRSQASWMYAPATSACTRAMAATARSPPGKAQRGWCSKGAILRASAQRSEKSRRSPWVTSASP